jgi:NADH:ubiquinone oxidoreductase subunit E
MTHLDASTSTELIDAVHRRLRTYDLIQIARTGNYQLAYCQLCRCTKSGGEDIPNRPNDACEDGECRCHDGWEPVRRCD